METLIGKDLGRYHIIEKLGQGGMATVYKAYDTRLERDVAVKIIRKEAFPAEVHERILKRFEREAKSLAKMSHANIVKVYDYGEHDGAPYLVMENLSGGTLKERLGQPVPYTEAAWLLAPIARALVYAHGEGILHRDVKPSNILITQSGEPVLTDFGIAKLLESTESHTLTGTGVGVGTPEYMAPEQGLGKEIDGRADVYALGVVFYELVTGRKPYTAETPMAVLLKQFNDPLPRPRDYAPGLPESVEKVLFKALAKQPEDRYADMAGFARALEELAAAPGQEKQRPPIAPQPQPRRAAPLPDPNATYDELATPTPARPLRAVAERQRKEEEARKAEVERQRKAEQTRRAEAESSLKKEKAGSKPAVIIAAVLALFVLLVLGFPQMFFPAPRAAPVPATEKAAVESSQKWDIQVRPADKMEMVHVPAGAFVMGSEDGDSNAYDDEFPQHTLYLGDFWIDQYEVTNAQYQMCVQDGKCNRPNNRKYYNDAQYADHPVVYVNWYDARDYCAWAGGRLPTEAEWEKAARGTDGRTYPWGEQSPNPDLLNYDGNIDSTTAVGSYPAGASPYGALDMAGNVWEWTSSLDQGYPYDSKDGREDPEASGSRVLRGGSWVNSERNVRAADRDGLNPDNSNLSYGFRCVASQ